MSLKPTLFAGVTQRLATLAVAPSVSPPFVPARIKSLPGTSRRLMDLAGAAFIFLATFAAGAQTPGPLVVARVDASESGPPICPYVYGQFLEHAGNLIYDSMWSEMLDDRKFYYDVTNQPAEGPGASQRRSGGFGPGRRRNVGPGRWNPIGPADSVVMDTRNPFVGDHTPLIRLADGEPCGICQPGINFVEGNVYNGRIQLAGDPTVKVAVNIVWSTNSDGFRQVVPLGNLGSDYKKFTFSFKAGKSGAARFEIVGTGTGSFRVGAVSLMPADNLEGWRPEAFAALKSLHSGVYRFPGISRFPVDFMPNLLTFPRFSANICEFPVE